MPQSLMHAIQEFYSQIFDPDRLPVAIMAVLIVLIVGMFRPPLGGNTTPILWHLTDKLFGNLGSKMDKPERLKGDLIFRGLMLTTMVVSIFFVFGRFFERIISELSGAWYLEGFLLILCMASGSSIFALAQLYKALNKKAVDNDSYYRIARSTRTNLSKSDDYSITRVGMGMMVRAFDKGVVAPVIWYLIFGITGAFVYTALAALSWRFGKDGKSRGFGQVAIALEKLLGFVPNVLAGLYLGLSAAFTPTAGFFSAFKGWFISKGRATYEAGGLAVTSAAWGLKVSLGGPTQDVDGAAIKRAWTGPPKATAQLESVHLHRVIYITFIAHILFIASLSGAMIFDHVALFEQISNIIGK